MILGQKHDKQIDFWCFGIIIYEMLTGWPPFIGKNRQMIFNKILSFDIEFDPIDKISDQAQDIIRKLLTKKPEEGSFALLRN
jgi:serine/threonine protein kinase